ncbi:MAG: hypothetical protein AABW47_03160 [Nanoarchaeota archaeon]
MDDLERSVRGVKDFRKFAEEEIILIRKDITSVISRKSKDGEHIEHTLDNLLSLIQLGVGSKEFHELNDFYATFCLQGAENYKKIYEELIKKKY